ARVRPLAVAGAFHTPYMAPAEQALAEVAAGISPADPQRILLSNADGTAVNHGRDMLRRLVRQVTSPVRWDLCMRALADLGVTAVVELPPAGTLTGLVKRELKERGVPEIVNLNTPDDLPAARDLIARHGSAPGHEPTPHFHVVVSTAAGTFSPDAAMAEGAAVAAGQRVGHVETRQGPVDVLAHAGGALTEWLAHADDPVAPGQPLARIGGGQP
ncbi:MAG TPA: ACP S-malonyltransferase, partial [Pilimelia sp.]|nr:ACP S-malonyltransferase [Pilimelia sp.]